LQEGAHFALCEVDKFLSFSGFVPNSSPPSEFQITYFQYITAASLIMLSNAGLIFKKVPKAFPVIGEHINVETRELDPDMPPPEGGLTVKNIYISFDPYQRGCMREPDDASWAPPFTPEQPILSGAVSKVLKSAVEHLHTGDLVWGMFGTEEYSVVPHYLVPMVRKLENPLGLDPVLFTGALGVSGLSAYGPF
jgi:NADPH-dependent curcumin reductase CurA